MAIYPVGTMVRVRDDALEYDDKNGDVNASLVERHGYIWFVEEHSTAEPNFYICKSMATGESGIIFFDRELETYEEIADA